MPFTIFGGEPQNLITIEFSGAPPVSDEDIAKQHETNEKLGLPQVNHSASAVIPHGRRLAVIGGGPSINDNVEKIRDWDGDRWAINGAYHWCKKRGFDATFLACDPHIIVADWAKGVTKAIVTTRCNPEVFKVLASQNAEVQTFNLDSGEKIIHGSSMATAVPHLSALNGYTDVTFFGCDSSYNLDHTHAYMKEIRKEEMIIRCNGEDFYTAPDWLLQAQELAVIISSIPSYSEESGGLLRAMMQARGEYQILWVSSDMVGRLTRKGSDAEAA